MKQSSILIVDDSPANIDALRAQLTDEYRIKVALNGVMALKAALTDPQPDLILLDVMMPEMDGFETCKRLKSDLRTRDIPVIFVTAKTEEVDEVEGFSVGAVDYVTKPPQPLILKSRIRSHLALYNQRNELWRQVKEKTSELVKTRTEVIHQLGRAAEFKDNETGFHVIRMSKSAHLIALEFGLSEKQAELIQNVAPMHDVGKLGIPDSILRKPGRLDKDEWAIMVQHPQIGAHILGSAASSPLTEEARIVALTHHERWDGKGYPNGLVGEDIPVSGRICAVADVFDALISERPYKDPWPVDKAVDFVKANAGQMFEPTIVDAFLRALPKILEVNLEFSESPQQTEELEKNL